MAENKLCKESAERFKTLEYTNRFDVTTEAKPQNLFVSFEEVSSIP